jgi:prophage antirepressor-like protein
MSSIIQFQFDSHDVRVIADSNGDSWFVAADVAKALDYAEAKDMTRNLDDDEKGRQIVPTLGGEQVLITINEYGLYSAILKSRKPEAKRFKRWVTHEVLPSIRKTGSYAMLTPSVPGDLYARALKAEKDEAASMALASVAGKALSLRRKEKRVLAQIVGLLREEVQLKLTLASIDGGVK